MNTHARLSGISGKSLLVFAGIILLLSVVAGEAAAVTVSGRVTNLTGLTGGASVTNVFVVAMTLNFTTFLAEAQPNGGGNYTISLPNMAPGTQFLVFVDPQNTRLVSALDDTIQKTVTIPLTGDITGVDFRLVDGVKLSGKVTVQSTNGGADGVIVFATNPALGWKFLGQVTTQAPSGTYDNLLVPPDETVELAVDKQGKFPGTVVDPPFLPVDVAGLDLIIRDFLLIPGVIVQGHVTDGVQSILNALVEAFFVSSDPNVGWVWLGDDTTGLDGFYSVAVAFEWGEILLRVTASGFVERRVEVVLVSPTTTVDVVLSTSVQISGRVTDASYGNLIPNVPVEAAWGNQILDLVLTGDGVNAPLGSYTLDVPPNQGLVFIHVDATSIDYLQPGDGEVVVGIVDFTGIDFALTPAVKISGTVKAPDADGTLVPVNGAGVTAFQGKPAVAFDLTGSSGIDGFYTLKVAKAAAGQSYTVDIHVDAGTLYQTADKFNIVVGQTNIQGVDFELNLAVKTEKVTITKADWVNNLLTVFATDSLQPKATLRVTVVKNGTNVVNNATMTFSRKRQQYEFRLRTKTNLNGGNVTVTSNGGVSAGPVTIPLTASCVSGTTCQ